MKWSIISAVNNEAVLQRCLLRSPDIRSATDIILQRGAPNIAAAYNSGIQKANADVLVFAHQDVYLPEGWIEKLESALEITSKHSSRPWAVMGVLGVAPEGNIIGHIFCAGNQRIFGEPFKIPREAMSLDECVLILNRQTGIRFDHRLPGFHFYGTDICMEARIRNCGVYAISNLCIHNTNGYGMFPVNFWRCYFYMRRKWILNLPLKTPCVQIQKSYLGVGWGILRRYLWLKIKRPQVGARVPDPVVLYNSLSNEAVHLGAVRRIAN